MGRNNGVAQGRLAPARECRWCGQSWEKSGLHKEGENHADTTACRVQARKGRGWGWGGEARRREKEGGQALEVPVRTQAGCTCVEAERGEGLEDVVACD